MIALHPRRIGRWAVASLLLVACTGAATETPPAASGTPGEPAPAAAAKPEQAALPAAEALLADAVEAMGGAARFSALKSYYAESQLTMGGLGLTGVAKTWWRGEDFLNETEMPGVGQMKVGGTRDRVWGDDPINGVRLLSGKEAEQARWSASLCLAHEWKRHFKSAETVGVKQEGGKQLAEVALVSPLGDRVTLRIDMATKLPVSQSFTQANPLGDMPATVLFEDFRDVDGLKLPFKQVVDASLTKAVSTTSLVKLDAPVDGVAFDMPGAAEAVVPGALVDAVPPVTPPQPDKGDKKRKPGKG